MTLASSKTSDLFCCLETYAAYGCILDWSLTSKNSCHWHPRKESWLQLSSFWCREQGTNVSEFLGKELVNNHYNLSTSGKAKQAKCRKGPTSHSAWQDSRISPSPSKNLLGSCFSHSDCQDSRVSPPPSKNLLGSCFSHSARQDSRVSPSPSKNLPGSCF